jgi:hypothetical protein
MQAKLLYYYRPLRRYPSVYKCAGHGAENPEHRAFYVKFWTKLDTDPVYLPGCIVRSYQGDRITLDDSWDDHCQ